jgi:hypothetical protein
MLRFVIFFFKQNAIVTCLFNGHAFRSIRDSALFEKNEYLAI